MAFGEILANEANRLWAEIRNLTIPFNAKYLQKCLLQELEQLHVNHAPVDWGVEYLQWYLTVQLEDSQYPVHNCWKGEEDRMEHWIHQVFVRGSLLAAVS